MSTHDEWQQRLDRTLDDIRRSGAKLTNALAAIRGRGEVRGVTIEVDTSGQIVNLQIAPGAMRWSNTQLAEAILDCHLKARADATAKADTAMQAADPVLQGPLQQIRNTPAPARPEPRLAMTEEEIQAADDAYYERMNRNGWNYSM